MEQIYRAMRTFDDLMNSEENHIRLKMKPGDMVTVKNMRVMHGRAGFKKNYSISRIFWGRLKGKFQR